MVQCGKVMVQLWESCFALWRSDGVILVDLGLEGTKKVYKEAVLSWIFFFSLSVSITYFV
jgi:hypothetical protein